MQHIQMDKAKSPATMQVQPKLFNQVRPVSSTTVPKTRGSNAYMHASFTFRLQESSCSYVGNRFAVAISISLENDRHCAPTGNKFPVGLVKSGTRPESSN